MARGHRLSNQALRRLRHMSRVMGNVTHIPQGRHYRSKYPVGVGENRVKVYRITDRMWNGNAVTGIRQKPGVGPSGWVDANDREIDLVKNFSWGYHFSGDVVLVRRIAQLEIISEGYHELLGKLDADLTSGNSATVSIWENNWNGDTGDNIDTIAWTVTLAATIPSGTKVRLAEVGPGGWKIVGQECD